MITPSFALTATERVLPKLALDFTTASLDSRITFTRTTDATHPATYTNSSGLVTSATNNQARFDYDPIALTCKGLLIEESRTNVLLYSEQMNTVGTWNKSNMTVSADAAVAPDGNTTADKLINDTGVVGANISQALSVTNGTTYTYSLYLKAAGNTSFIILANSNIFADAQLRYCTYNLSNGTYTIAGGSGTTASITNVGNGWYRCTFTFTATATVTSSIQQRNNNTGNGTDGVYAWGAQCEAGAFPTSYIPTTTTALTRNADVATMTGTNFSSWYNASEGAMFAETIVSGFPPTATYPQVIRFSDGTTNNYIGTNYTNATTTSLYAYGNSVVNGVTETGFYGASSSPFVTGTINRTLVAYKLNNSAFSTDGLATQVDTTCAIPVVDRLVIGTGFNGWMRKISYWPQRLINREVQAFSK